MTDQFAPIVIGTATLSLTMLLLLLRAQVHGRRPVLLLARRWAHAGPVASAGVLAVLLAISLTSFAVLGPRKVASVPAVQAQVSPDTSEDPFVEQDLAALSSYAAQLDGAPHPTPSAQAGAPAADLPAVDAMVEKLVARLKEKPDDVRGWKMLGWSYLNTGKPDDAVRAYETAAKLDPADSEITKGLEAAKASRDSPK